jgi:hypothetical protein
MSVDPITAAQWCAATMTAMTARLDRGEVPPIAELEKLRAAAFALNSAVVRRMVEPLEPK